jgi:diguanylate cyclase (GGDEF)-like protein/PAS domain S-box-containing protein
MLQISAEQLLDSLFDGVYFVDLDRRITYWNAAAERITGYLKENVIGRGCADNLLRHIDAAGCELCVNGCPLAATMHDGRMREAGVFLHHALGHRVPVSVRSSPVRDESGSIIGAVEIFCDNSSSLQILQEFERLKQTAYLDVLTAVGNRRYGEMTLSTRLFEMQEHDVPFGVLFMDIDHFKRFNDSYGHKTGDDVLVMVAKSIALSLRKMDVVARWGGEEFIVILPGANAIITKSVSERIRVLIEKSFLVIESKKVHVTVSIGATMSHPDDSAETIVIRADKLMYLSKDGGRNRVTVDEDHGAHNGYASQ